jgi:ATP-dependent Lon protease
MPPSEDPSEIPASFSGRARLFPLADLVMFPHGLQPLHVFEPRYRALLEAALNSDQLIAMAVVQPGQEDQLEGQPDLLPMACLSRVIANHRTDDGRYYVMLRGLCRVELARELPLLNGYRVAEARSREDLYSDGGESRRAELHQSLVKWIRGLLADRPQVLEQLGPLVAENHPLGTATDVLAQSLNIEGSLKRQLLLELDVERRAALLVQWLAEASQGNLLRGRDSGEFPPGFSLN